MHMRWLRALSFDDVCSQATFVDYLRRGRAADRAPRDADRHSRAADPRAARTPRVIARLRCFRGIDTLTAAGVCAEVGHFRRFPSPTLLSGFLGIVPSERTIRHQTPAGIDHQSRTRRTPAGCWSRPPTTTDTHHRIGDVLARRQARAGPADHRDRLTRPTPPARPLAAPAPHRDASPPASSRSPSRASSPRSSGRPPPLTRQPHRRSRPGRCRGEHEHPGRPITIARGSREHYGQPAPSGRARS